jgi:protein-tyrosine phosphatase
MSGLSARHAPANEAGIARWVSERYGSKRGFMRHVGYRLVWRWRWPGLVDPSQPLAAERLIFVCRGNICRSALAEAVANSRGIDACSYGLDTVAGKPADPRMCEVAGELGYDLLTHAATPFERYRAARGDVLLLMEPGHLAALAVVAPSLHARMGLLGLWADPQRPYIHDPYAANDRYMRICARAIERAVLNLGCCLQRTDVG